MRDYRILVSEEGLRLFNEAVRRLVGEQIHELNAESIRLVHNGMRPQLEEQLPENPIEFTVTPPDDWVVVNQTPTSTVYENTSVPSSSFYEAWMRDVPSIPVGNRMSASPVIMDFSDQTGISVVDLMQPYSDAVNARGVPSAIKGRSGEEVVFYEDGTSKEIPSGQEEQQVMNWGYISGRTQPTGWQTVTDASGARWTYAYNPYIDQTPSTSTTQTTAAPTATWWTSVEEQQRIREFEQQMQLRREQYLMWGDTLQQTPTVVTSPPTPREYLSGEGLWQRLQATQANRVTYIPEITNNGNISSVSSVQGDGSNGDTTAADSMLGV